MNRPNVWGVLAVTFALISTGFFAMAILFHETASPPRCWQGTHEIGGEALWPSYVRGEGGGVLVCVTKMNQYQHAPNVVTSTCMPLAPAAGAVCDVLLKEHESK